MSDLIEGNNISKTRLLTAISLIMILEHKKLNLSEVIHATGMEFNEIRSALQNLVNLRLIKVIPTQNGIPNFALIDAEPARKYLNILGVTPPEKVEP